MRFLQRLMVASALVATTWHTARAQGDEARVATSPCPAYVAYLRSARLHLSRGDRAAVLSELRAAKRALEACAGSAAPARALAGAFAQNLS
jgi:predicted nicotinamide N-methyase